MNWKMRLLFISICIFTLLAAFVSEKADKSDFETATELIVMRKIAHQVLQYAGDSTSRILPANRISSNEYQVQFEGSFSFSPDSLVVLLTMLSLLTSFLQIIL